MLRVQAVPLNQALTDGFPLMHCFAFPDGTHIVPSPLPSGSGERPRRPQGLQECLALGSPPREVCQVLVQCAGFHTGTMDEC